jgi:hypothetical protein
VHPAPRTRLSILLISRLCHSSTHEWYADNPSVHDWRQIASSTSLPGASITRKSHKRPNAQSQTIQPDSLAAVLQARPQFVHAVLQATPQLTTRLRARLGTFTRLQRPQFIRTCSFLHKTWTVCVLRFHSLRTLFALAILAFKYLS